MAEHESTGEKCTMQQASEIISRCDSAWLLKHLGRTCTCGFCSLCAFDRLASEHMFRKANPECLQVWDDEWDG